ncbi:hypothetical protein [Yersinia kristensenii]|nr:hypothetical protein [Yersinia kristensenii]EEP89290.1 hypothetical protein ykris0001_43260 [Yersinia kristensenii ATCC 33638]MBW5813959.1 hypothetical protein [Yersinia kristensenii]MBW5816700.1 hypothetical protein [Yersinia kristensenii]MBW5826450.1 hypothetical protein [Yersinia kristensenii]MBW5831147.1 hypothetical protein [Yersinia kristensenii]
MTLSICVIVLRIIPLEDYLFAITFVERFISIQNDAKVMTISQGQIPS